MQDLIKLSVSVEADRDELLAAILAVNAPTGWAEETLPTGETLAVVHTDNPLHADEVEQAVRSLLPEALVRRESVAARDWTEAWREFFTPVPAGDFLVLAPWMTAERESATARVIVIEPKMAFGTGHHETTALCLKALSALSDQGKIRPGTRFLDLGCGSGILGIGCALLGLRGLGLDIDILSVENSVENRAVNGIPDDALAICRGSIEEADGPFDLILANILADPLVDMAPRIVERLAANGSLVLSGLLEVQAERVIAAYRAQGLGDPDRLRSGEWSALVWS